MKCPHCQQTHQDGIRFCPNTGMEIPRLIKCPHCSGEHPIDTDFCPLVGAPLTTPKICPYCGEQADKDWLICAYCGSSLSMELPTTSSISTRTAATTLNNLLQSPKKGMEIVFWVVLIFIFANIAFRIIGLFIN